MVTEPILEIWNAVIEFNALKKLKSEVYILDLNSEFSL